jgi:hypothetical protein
MDIESHEYPFDGHSSVGVFTECVVGYVDCRSNSYLGLKCDRDFQEVVASDVKVTFVVRCNYCLYI